MNWVAEIFVVDVNENFDELQVQNAVEFLKMIGALDENENLTHLGMVFPLNG